jgi:glycosyltransferase involved in cell wall biosynthesis
MQVLIVHRPGGAIGGDVIAAKAYGAALERHGVEVSIRPADKLADVTAFDWVHMWSANAPQWGYPTAVSVRQQGVRLIITPNWWSRKARLDYFGYLEQDVAPGYTNRVAQTLDQATVLFVCAMSEAVECWKLAPFRAAYWLGHGCDIDTEQQQPEDYVACLARIEPHKNQVNLAMACRALGLPLKLVGSIGDPAVLAQAKAIGAEHIQPDSRADALDILARARVHALPSFSETPGMSNMEAARLNVPAVMGNIGAEPEFFGCGGLYADPRNWRQIAQAVQIAWQEKRLQWAAIPSWDTVAKRGLEYMGA